MQNEINGNLSKVRPKNPNTVEGKKNRDLHTVKNIGKIADVLFRNDTFVHPSKLPNRTGKSTIRPKK